MAAFSGNPFSFASAAEMLLQEVAHSYSLPGVVASVAIAIFAAFCAFEMARRSRQSRYWVPLGALMLGLGVWAMHFIGMSAFRLNCAVAYDPWLTVLSVLPALLAASLALRAIAAPTLSTARLLRVGIVLGGGVGLMHYTGMAAFQFQGRLLYEPGEFVFALLAAIGAATLALHLNRRISASQLRRIPYLASLAGAVVLGLAISSMHYIAMEAARFIALDGVTLRAAMDPATMGWLTGFATLMLLGFGLLYVLLYSQAQSARKRYETILNTTQQGFVMLDEAGCIVQTNAAMAAMLKMTAQQIHSLTLPQLLDQALPVTEGAYQLQANLRCADGSHLPCIVFGNTFVDSSDGKVVSFALFSDISQRLRTEAALRAVNQEQSAILGTASVGIVLLKQRVITQCNHGLDDIFGYARGELKGQSTRIWYYHDEDYARVDREGYPHIYRGEIYTQDFQFRRKDGSPFWARTSSRVIDEQHPELGVVVIVWDITAERTAQESIELANEEQRAILDTATSGIALIRERTLHRCNRRLHEMFGWPLWEMLGQQTSIWYADAEANRIGALPYDTIWSGQSHTREQQLMRKDGSLFWARLQGNAVDVNDPSKGTVWIIDDITGDREMNDALRLAKDKAEAATRAKSDFLSNMSHEIRTPMNAVLGMVYLLGNTALTAQQRKYLNMVRVSGQSLLGILNDVLDFSKI
ncbi:MAG: PAS domain S-box protein, partial [Burkholderiaceae bacterium]|nr:PAS domain S-box protein [Burkholderiaceae bacterium]